MPHAGQYSALLGQVPKAAPGVTLDQVSRKFEWKSPLHELVRAHFTRNIRPGWLEEAERVMKFGQEQTRWMQGLKSPSVAQTRDYQFALDRLNALGDWVQEVQGTGPARFTQSWDWDTDLPQFQRLHDLQMQDVLTSLAALRQANPTAQPEPTAGDEARGEGATNWVTLGSYLGVGLSAYGLWQREPGTTATGLVVWGASLLLKKVPGL